MPLVYCHINSFQQAFSVERSLPGGENRRGGRAAHHEKFEAIGSLLLPYAATGLFLLAVWCLIGATPRGQFLDVCSDAPAGAQWAERAADGGVVYVSRALSSATSRSFCLVVVTRFGSRLSQADIEDLSDDFNVTLY